MADDVTIFFTSIDRAFDQTAVDEYAVATSLGTWTSAEQRQLAVRLLWI